MSENRDVADCPSCDGEAYQLGKLGAQWHYRCRNCGYTFPGGTPVTFRSDGSALAMGDLDRVRRDRPFTTAPLTQDEHAIASRVHLEKSPSRKRKFK